MATLNDIDQHIQQCGVCMSQLMCYELGKLVNSHVAATHGDVLAAAGEVKVSRFFHPGDPISRLQIEKRGSRHLYTQEEAAAIELGINKLLHGEED